MNLTPESSSADASETTFRLLLRLFGSMRRVMDPFFAQHGISGPQWGILHTLQRLEAAGQPCPRLSDLSHHMLIRPPSITAAVDRLIRTGLIQKAGCDEDHRVKRVELSPAGRKLARQLSDGHSARMAAVFGVLSAEQQQQFRSMLGGLITHLESFDKTPALVGLAGSPTLDTPVLESTADEENEATL